ncbi:MAG: hypothetical protein H0W50_00560 [Parachlamydiaceae bacterium]|nr:hypothetical protein [Parachlamydiaceae bacterium]
MASRSVENKLHHQNNPSTYFKMVNRSNGMARLACWIRNPSENSWEFAKKTSLFALTTFLALSVIGLLVVLPAGFWAAYEWRLLKAATNVDLKSSQNKDSQSQLAAPEELRVRVQDKIYFGTELQEILLENVVVNAERLLASVVIEDALVFQENNENENELEADTSRDCEVQVFSEDSFENLSQEQCVTSNEIEDIIPQPEQSIPDNQIENVQSNLEKISATKWNSCCENALKFVTIHDLRSLLNLSKIKSGQKIDVYPNGTISEPYVNDNSASIWRTARWLTGWSKNSDGIVNLKDLMQRALYALYLGCDELNFCLEEATKGLEILADDYKNKPIENEIRSILEFVNRSTKIISHFHRQNPPLENITYGYAKKTPIMYNLLESSYIGSDTPSGTHSAFEGVDYYINRLDFFLFLEKEILDDEDVRFLSYLREALKDSKKNKCRRSFFEKLQEKRLQLCSLNNVEWKDSYDIAMPIVKKEMAEVLIDTLEAFPPNVQSQIGIQIPMGFSWDDANGLKAGHVFFITLCRNDNGSYRAAQVNAGGLSLAGSYENVKFNLHANRTIPFSINFSPVVEFPSLSREEALSFLIKVEDKKTRNFYNYEDAKKNYSEIFEDIIEKKCTVSIPPRRAQVSGNCGIRSLKESLIYSFQKYGNVDLANKFLTYVDGRSSETLAFEKVIPLIK